MSANEIQSYQKEYTELDLLGRGAFGSAYLVQSKSNNQFYVAKKMMLEGLSKNQIASAWGQIEILKTFSDMSCPFIVAYKQCFHFDNTLVIIMEYCEHGDLATFLKNRKKKDQLIDQKVIVNWFIQMLFGIQVLHSKKVLHRDLKAANIFLTHNKTIKIGDFGISKVLDNTSAKTFVGTPYYLSPQVCQNRPYDYKSDVWSLGCILYQMCTLAYPFQASNLLGLAMKILNDQVKPISNFYTKQLNEIVMLLLTKNENHRVTIKQILQKPYIKKQMETFMQDRDIINKMVHIPVRKIGGQAVISKIGAQNQSKTSTQGTMKTVKSLFQNQNEDTMKTIQSNFQGTSKADTLSYSGTMGITGNANNMTNTERIRLKKMQKADQEGEKLKNNSKEAYEARMFSKNKFQQNLGTSGSNFGQNNELEKKYQMQNKEKSELEKTKVKLLQKNQPLNLLELHVSLTQQMQNTKKPVETHYEDVPLPSNYKKNVVNDFDQRPLPSKVDHYEVPKQELDYQQNFQEQIEEELQEYYDQEFQDYEESKIKTLKTLKIQKKQEIQDVQAFYACFAGLALSPTKKAKVESANKEDTIVLINTDQKINRLKMQAIQQIGQNKFKDFYKKIKTNSFDYSKMKTMSHLQKSSIQKIESIVYMEENNKN